jgi:WD40 repeat protein
MKTVVALLSTLVLLYVLTSEPLDAQEKPKAVLEGHKGEIAALAFSPDGKHLAVGTVVRQSGKREPGLVKLWEVAAGKEKAKLEWPNDGISALTFSGDGKTLIAAYGTRDKDLPRYLSAEIKLWDLDQNKEKATLKTTCQGIYALALSADGKTLAAAGWTEEKKEVAAPVLVLFDLPEGKERSTIKGMPPDTGMHPVVFLPGSQNLLWASDGKGLLLIEDGGAKKGAFQEKVGHVYSLALSPDGKTLACGHDVEGLITIWEVEGRKKLHTLKEDQDRLRVAFAPDGKTLISVGDKGALKLWDAATGKETAGVASAAPRVSCLATTHKGGLIAVGSKDGSVSLWELGRLQPRAPHPNSLSVPLAQEVERIVIEGRRLAVDEPPRYVVKDPKRIEQFVSFLNARNNGWRKSLGTFPGPEWTVTLEKGENQLLGVWLGPNWLGARVGAQESPSNNRLRTLTDGEQKQVFIILGLVKD